MDFEINTKKNIIVTKNRKRVPFKDELPFTSFLKAYTYRFKY